jgi:hypothetical protein
MISQAEKLKTAIATGNNEKRDDGFGKEYYALYVGHMPDAILEFISGKIDLMYPDLRKNSWISIPGVAFRLLDYKQSIYVAKGAFLYIHKASFKRHLKKAICRNRNPL